MDRVALESSSDSHAVSQVANRLVLWVEDEHLPAGIVIQREFGAGQILLGALWSLGKGFFKATSTVHDDAGPRSEIWILALPRQCQSKSEKNRHHANHGEIHSKHV